jgi:hypothetical protein
LIRRLEIEIEDLVKIIATSVRLENTSRSLPSIKVCPLIRPLHDYGWHNADADAAWKDGNNKQLEKEGVMNHPSVMQDSHSAA